MRAAPGLGLELPVGVSFGLLEVLEFLLEVHLLERNILARTRNTHDRALGSENELEIATRHRVLVELPNEPALRRILIVGEFFQLPRIAIVLRIELLDGALIGKPAKEKLRLLVTLRPIALSKVKTRR